MAFKNLSSNPSSTTNLAVALSKPLNPGIK